MLAAGPVVLVANHSALLDGPLLFGMLGRRSVFLVKQEMFRGPLRLALPRIGQLAVHRGEPDRGGPIMAAVALLRGGGGPGGLPGTRRPPGVRRRWRPRVGVLVGEPLELAAGRGRAALGGATETVRAALAGLVVELDEVRSRT